MLDLAEETTKLMELGFFGFSKTDHTKPHHRHLLHHVLCVATCDFLAEINLPNKTVAAPSTAGRESERERVRLEGSTRQAIAVIWRGKTVCS